MVSPHPPPTLPRTPHETAISLRIPLLCLVAAAVPALDRFWALKDRMYGEIINLPSNIVCEAALSRVVDAIRAGSTALLAEFESVKARKLTASIVVVEARMAVVLSHFGGLASNLDDIFVPEAEAFDLAAGAES